MPFLEYFSQSTDRLVLILGPFGSGKTTLLKALALRLISARRKQLANRSPVVQKLPIWLPLGRIREQLEVISPVDASAIWNCLRWDLDLRFGRSLGEKIFNVLQTESIDNGIFLLDGLDDIPDPTLRQAFVGVAEKFAAQIGPDATVVISGRPHVREAYLRTRNASILTMPPLSLGLSMEILASWMRALAEVAGKDASHYESRLRDLSLSIANRNDLRQLAERPLYLAALATMDATGKTSSSAVELYEAIVGLYLSQWTADAIDIEQRHHTELSQFRISEALAAHMAKIRSALERLAFQRLAATSNELSASAIGDSVIDSVLVYGIIASVLPETAAPRSVTRFLEERLGILASMSGGYTFPHKSIMEYLAACYIVNSKAPPEAIGKLLVRDPQAHREVLAFVFAKLVTLNKQFAADCLVDVLGQRLVGSCDELGSDLAVGKTVRIVSDHVVLLGVPTFDHYLDRLRERLSEDVDLASRAEIGDILNCCPDTRPGVGVTSVQGELPDIAWVRIVPGRVHAGSMDVRDPMVNTIELGLPKNVRISQEFHISRYPITVAQYQLFIDDGGYSSVGYWTAEGLEWIKGDWNSSWGEGSPWLAKHLETVSRQRLPLNWGDQSRFRNRPVVGVSWFESLAYANWLTSRYRNSSGCEFGRDLVVRLPHELEWEVATRAGDARQWPWGSSWRQDYANTNESGLDRICAVGLHHAADSPLGVSDMSGNTWDWTLSEFRPYGEVLRTVDPSQRDASVTVRGGSWCHDRFSARCAFRDWNVPDDRSDTVGFRLVIGHLDGHVKFGSVDE